MSTKIAPRRLWVRFLGLTFPPEFSRKLDPEKVALYLGGAGLGGRLLSDEVPASVSAFDPENRLIFFQGHLLVQQCLVQEHIPSHHKGVMTDLITTAQLMVCLELA